MGGITEAGGMTSWATSTSPIARNIPFLKKGAKKVDEKVGVWNKVFPAATTPDTSAANLLSQDTRPLDPNDPKPKAKPRRGVSRSAPKAASASSLLSNTPPTEEL